MPVILRSDWDDFTHHISSPYQPIASFIIQPNRMQKFQDPLLNLLTSSSMPQERIQSTLLKKKPLNCSKHKEIVELKINTNKDKFEIVLDVQPFSPEEISLKINDNENLIIVEGKHEEKCDNGSSFKHFIRKFKLPCNVNSNEMSSNLSIDGILTIIAPLVKEEIIPANPERIIPIEHVYPLPVEKNN